MCNSVSAWVILYARWNDRRECYYQQLTWHCRATLSQPLRAPSTVTLCQHCPGYKSKCRASILSLALHDTRDTRHTRHTTHDRMYVIDSMLTIMFFAGLFTKLMIVVITQTTRITCMTMLKLICSAALIVSIHAIQFVLSAILFVLLLARACVSAFVEIIMEAALTALFVILFCGLLVLRTFISVLMMVIVIVADLLLSVTLRIDIPVFESPLPSSPISAQIPPYAVGNLTAVQQTNVTDNGNESGNDNSKGSTEARCRNTRQLNSRDWNTWVPSGNASGALTSLSHRAMYAHETHISYSRTICERRDSGSMR